MWMLDVLLLYYRSLRLSSSLKGLLSPYLPDWVICIIMFKIIDSFVSSFCCWGHPLGFFFFFYVVLFSFLFLLYFPFLQFFWFFFIFLFSLLSFPNLFVSSMFIMLTNPFLCWLLKNLWSVTSTALSLQCWWLSNFFSHSSCDFSDSCHEKWFSIETWWFGVFWWDSGF